MTSVVLEGLWARKLRAGLTAMAIVLGVAMISGTYVLMDTTLHAFNGIFATAYSKAQAVVVGRSPISGAGVRTPSIPAVVVTRIRALPQVSAAQGFIEDRAELRNARGGAITGPSSPLALGAPAQGSVFNTLQLTAGHRPAGPDEIALDQQTAESNHFALGSTVGVVSRHPLRDFRLVGIVRFGGAGTLGPIQILAFDLPVAQRL